MSLLRLWSGRARTCSNTFKAPPSQYLPAALTLLERPTKLISASRSSPVFWIHSSASPSAIPTRSRPLDSPSQKGFHTVGYSTMSLEPTPPSKDEILSFRSALSPSIAQSESWYIVLLSALTSCHFGPEVVVVLYETALSEAKDSASDVDRKGLSQRIQKRIQETLVKGTVIWGISHSLDTMFTLLSHLREVSPDYLLGKDDFSRQELIESPISSLDQPAFEALDRIYQHNLPQILNEKMSDNMQDLKYLTLQINYGFNLANQKILDWKETELVILAALIPQNCRAEVLWHLRGAMRAGWNKDAVSSVWKTSIDVAKRVQVRVNRVPGMEEVKENSNE